ncbi:MAG: hypothetical protein IJH94_05755 [Clostridia bacterium]|nr:hypothetical protein [Clostridia bacterium]
MRKIYAGAFAVIAAMTVSATAVLAASTPMVTVTNEKSASVSYTYDPSSAEETKKDASRLFSEFRDATSKDYAKHVFTVTSMSRNNTPVEIYLKLEAEPVSDVYSVLDVYEIKVSDSQGNEIHHDTDFTDPGKSERTISLGTFNEQFTNDTRKFTVEYLLRDSMSHTVTKEERTKLNVYVASKPVEQEISANTENNEVSPVGEVKATDSPSVTEAPIVFGDESQPVAATAAASTPVPQTITKVCGTDITPGRYVVSGNGTVLIKSKTGETKSETVVTDGKTAGVKGVEQYVLTLSEGDQINMTALPGQEKPSIRFEKTNDTAAKTAVTTAPKAAARTATTAASKNNANVNTKTNANAKTNPKTGDSGVPVALLSIIMFGAAATIGGIEVYKRRNINK